MLQLGITKKEDIPAGTPSSRPIAFTLLPEATEEQWLAILFGMSAGPNVKRSFAGRYLAIDEAIEREIVRVFDDRPVRMLEMAASSGATTLDLFERLKHRRGVSVRATDFYNVIYVVPRGGWRVVLDDDGNVIQFVGKHLVLSGRTRETKWVNRRFQKRLLKQPAPPTTGAEQISLFHPRCIEAAARDPRFSLGREDAFNPDDSPCDVLRLMSFSRSVALEKSAEFFARICRRITDGGLFVVGDNPDIAEAPYATIFQRMGGKLTAIQDLGGGYDRKQILLDLSL